MLFIFHPGSKPEMQNKQVAAVMITAGRIATATQIDPLYSPSGAKCSVHAVEHGTKV